MAAGRLRCTVLGAVWAILFGGWLLCAPLFAVSVAPGWPKTSSHVFGWVALGDIDGDGSLEIVATEDHSVCAWHFDGTPVTGWPQPMPGLHYCDPVLQDIDGDGNPEVLIGSTDHNIYAWHGDGTPVAGWPVVAGGDVYTAPAVGDIDGDGRPEVVAAAGTFPLPRVIEAWRADGSALPGWPQALPGEAMGGPALGDLDGDGGLEVIAASSSSALQAYPSIHVWHSDGTPLAGWPVLLEDPTHVRSYETFGSPVPVDLDGDGYLEVMGGGTPLAFVWRADGTPLPGWPQGIDESTHTGGPLVGDLDGDGSPEVVVGGDDGRVYVYRADGTPFAEWPRQVGGWFAMPALADLDGDGDLEIVVSAGGGYDVPHATVSAWHHDGSPVAGWPAPTPGGQITPPVVADLDGDGKLEVVATSLTADGTSSLCVWSCDTTSTDRLAWPSTGSRVYTRKADFVATPRKGYAPLAVTFSHLSRGTPTAWAWDFGDGGASAEANPRHTYAAAGLYDVSLTITTARGAATETKRGYVTATSPPHEVIVQVAAPDPSRVGSGGVSALSATATDRWGHGIASWSWSDGGAGGAFSPSARVAAPTYAAPDNLSNGDLRITLTAAATCDGLETMSGSASTTLVVQPVYGSEVFYAETFEHDSKDNHGFTLQGDWAIGIPQKGSCLPPGPVAANSDGKVLAYNLYGVYDANISALQYATSPAVDCTGKTSVRVRFRRWLVVEDGAHDQMILQASKDLTNWVTVYRNPTDKDGAAVTDRGWVNVEYDISSVADNRPSVYLRWGLSSNATVERAGWSIDDIQLIAAASASVTNGAWGFGGGLNGWTTTGTVWEVGAPAGLGGHDVDLDGDGAATADEHEVGIGADPAAAPPHLSVLGTVLTAGLNPTNPGDYPLGMLVPEYATSPAVDCRGLRDVHLQFSRWLNIQDRRFATASIQVTDDPDPSTPAIEKQPAFTDRTGQTVKSGSMEYTYEISLSQYYETEINLKWKTIGMAAGGADSFRIEYSATGGADPSEWTTILTEKTTTDDGDPDTDDWRTLSHLLLPAPPATFDDGKLYLRVRILGPDEATAPKGTGVVCDVVVSGALWQYVWRNPITPAGGAPNPIFDTEWTRQSYPLPQADDKSGVHVRFSLGPTGSFAGPLSALGGWNIDNVALVEGLRQWRPASITAPTALAWGERGHVTVSAQNTGTAVWDGRFSLYEAEALPTPVLLDPSASPASMETVYALEHAPISRWGVGHIPVTGSVGPDQIASFGADIIAPPLSSVSYATPIDPSAPGDPTLSTLGCDWDLASITQADPNAAVPPLSWAGTYRDGSIAHAPVVVTRFSDDQPGTDGDWARFYIEELAGRVPMVVKGFGDGTYRPRQGIDRASMAVFIARAGLPAAAYATATGKVFADIPKDFWAAPWIEACANAGIVSGFPDHSYQPDLSVTRDAMAKFIVNGAGLVGPDGKPLWLAPNLWDVYGPDPTWTNWFGDVYIDDPDTPENEKSVFADYIATLLKAGVVQGYNPNPERPWQNEYRPAEVVTRDQLAVYVWRAFLRDKPGPVALGGPGVTEVDLTADPGWYGYASADSTMEVTDDRWLYLTFDALRFAGGGLENALAGGATPGLDVGFELRNTRLPLQPVAATLTTSLPLSTVKDWVTAVTSPTASGEPYRTVGLKVTGVPHGDYLVVAEVEGQEVVAPRPLVSVLDRAYSFDFDEQSDLDQWEDHGQPMPGAVLYPDPAAAHFDPRNVNLDLIYEPGLTANGLWASGRSAQLQGTQQLVKTLDTTGWNRVRLCVWVAATGLGAQDTVSVEWSSDGGVTWISLQQYKGAAAPARMTELRADLPDGDPNAPAGSATRTGANENPHFQVRLGINSQTANARAYFDHFTLEGA